MLLFLLVIEDEEIRNKLELIYDSYKQYMFYVAYDILKDYHESEDVVQSSILRIGDHLDKIPNVRDYKTKAFVVMVARNIAKNIYNKNKKHSKVPIEDYEDKIVDEITITPEENILRLDTSKWLAQQLGLIKVEYADILTLRYTYEYSNQEISELIDITEVNVRVRLNRAKKALNKIIGGEARERTC